MADAAAREAAMRDRLAALKARRAAIVGTRWMWNSYSQISADVPYGHPWDRQAHNDASFRAKGEEPDGPVCTDGGGVAAIAWLCQRPDHEGRGDELHSAEAEANARFIEQAPSDIDWLVAEVERLQAENERLRREGGYPLPTVATVGGCDGQTGGTITYLARGIQHTVPTLEALQARGDVAARFHEQLQRDMRDERP